MTRRAEAEHPPRGNFVAIDGVRLHYIERGQGRPLLLLHGNGDMAEDFELSGLLAQLATDYRVIAFDRPGYGYSERPRDRIWTASEQADLLHHAMLHLGIEQATVAAHSWGTLVALHMALKYPASVQGLVLMSGYYYPALRLDVPALSLPAVPFIGNLVRHTLSPLLGRLMWPVFTRRMFGPAPTHRRFADFPVWLALRPGQIRASAAETSMMVREARILRKRYRELTLPVVLLAGDADRHVNTRRQSMRLHRELPNNDLYTVPGAGHMVHYLAPRSIVSAVDAVARRIGDAPAARSGQSGESALRSAGTVGI